MGTELETAKWWLKQMTEAMLRMPCQFWACKGFEVEPENMITCYRCRLLHNLFNAYPELKAELWDSLDRTKE